MKKLILLLFAIIVPFFISCSSDEKEDSHRNPTTKELSSIKMFVYADTMKNEVYTLAFGTDIMTSYRSRNDKIVEYETFEYSISGDQITLKSKRVNATSSYIITAKIYDVASYPHLVISGKNMPSSISAGDYMSV